MSAKFISGRDLGDENDNKIERALQKLSRSDSGSDSDEIDSDIADDYDSEDD